MKSRVIFILSLFWMAVLVATPVWGKEIVYRLKWKFNTSVAGDIFADSGGYFKEKGLDINVKAGGVGIDAIRELELGRAGFGVASADQVILAVEKGAKIVVVAQLFQANPLQWIYRADQPEIKTLADLKNKRIGVTFGGNDDAIMSTILARSGLGKNEVKIISVQGNALPFFKKDADLWPVYLNSQGVSYADQLAREGEKVRFFNPQNFGVSFVANSVITSKELIEKQPQLVKDFLTALLDAWEAAMDPANEAAVLGAVKKLDGGINDNVRKKQLDATRTLIKPKADLNIGLIDVSGWRQTEEILLKEGQIKKKVGIENYLIQ